MSRQLSKPPHTAAARGFTIIELMITIVIAAVLLAVAVPSFSDAMSKTNAAQKTNDLVGAFTLARSEAASRSRTVCVDAIDGDWNKGWNVNVDMNTNNKCTDADTDTLLRTYASPGNGFVVTSTNKVKEIAFSSTGALFSGTNQSIEVCRKGGSATHASLVTVQSAGLVTSYRKAAATGTSCAN